MSTIAQPIPHRAPVCDVDVNPSTGRERNTNLMSSTWIQYLLGIKEDLQHTNTRLRGESLAAQSASLGSTPLPLPALAAGLYRVSYYARITQPATTSSSLIVTIAFTDGSVACFLAGAALATNTSASVQSGTFLIRSDAASPISYSTTYVSVGATPMQYRLDLTVEAAS